MANLFMTGFEEYDTANFLKEWWYRTDEWCMIENNGLFGKCLVMHNWNGNAGNGRFVQVLLPTVATEGVLGFRFKNEASADIEYPIAYVGDLTRQHLVLSMTVGGAFKVYRTSAGWTSVSGNTGWGHTLLASGTGSVDQLGWNYVEWRMKIHDTEGEVEVRLNGSPTPDILVTGLDTRNAGDGQILWFGLGAVGPPTGLSGQTFFDDVYFNDTTGLQNNGFEGDVRIDTHFVTADGAHSEFTPSTSPPGDNYVEVDDAIVDTANYNEGAISSTPIDTFVFENYKNPGLPLKCVQIVMLAMRPDAGYAEIAPVIRKGSTDYVGTALVPAGGWGRYNRQSYDLQPDDEVWTEADFNAMEIGYKKTG